MGAPGFFANPGFIVAIVVLLIILGVVAAFSGGFFYN